MAVQLVATGRSGLAKSVALGSIETAYSSYFTYDRRPALLPVTVSRSDGFPPVSQRTSRDGVGSPVATEFEVQKTG